MKLDRKFYEEVSLRPEFSLQFGLRVTGINDTLHEVRCEFV